MKSHRVSLASGVGVATGSEAGRGDGFASCHRNGDIDAEVAVIRKQLGDRGVKYEAVRVEDS